MVGLLVTGFADARLLADIPASRLAEARGRRPVLIAGPIILAVGSLACGLAQSYWQLIIFRMLQGMGLYRAISDIGPLVGPMLLGWFADMNGYGFAILFNKKKTRP